MPGDIPEKGFVYKAFRRTPDGELCSYITIDRMWEIRYPEKLDFTPLEKSGHATTWMFVFQTLEQTQRFVKNHRIREEKASSEIWRCLVFEDLSSLEQIICKGDVKNHGTLFWQSWFNRGLLGSMQEGGISLYLPPEGTHVCSKIRLVEKMPLG